MDDLANQADNSVLLVPDPAAMMTGLSDFRQIVAQFDAWSAFFATSLPSPTNSALLALFDSTFLFGGNDLNDLLADITLNPLFIGAKFTNVSVQEISANTAKARFAVQYGGGRSDAVTFVVNKVGGVWLLAGDQRIVDLSVYAYAANREAPYNPGITTGLWVVFHPGAVSPSPAIDYAVVTGKGLPTSGGGRDGISSGALLVDYSNGNFNFAQGRYNGANTPRLTDINGFTIFSSQLPLSDTNIGLIADNETYTVDVYSDNNTPSDLTDDQLLATYTEVVGKRPYLSTELSVASFPAVSTTVAQVGTFANNGGSLTANWTLPSGLKGDEFDFARYGGVSDLEIDNTDLSATATSVTVSWPAPAFNVTGYHIQVGARDIFNRSLETVVGN